MGCFGGRIVVGGQPHPKLWGKYKKPKPRFHRFCYENPLKIENTFSKFVFAVLVQNHEDIMRIKQQYIKITNTCDKFVKKKSFLMRFCSKIYVILAWTFCIFPITLGRVDPQQLFDHRTITN